MPILVSMSRLFLESLRSYCNSLEELLQQNKVEHENALNAGQLTWEEDYYHSGELSRFDGVFPKILRSSFLVACYSYLEYELTDYCRYLRKEHSLPLDVNDLKGSGIERASKYLNHIAKLDFPDTDLSWNEIRYLNKIRNFIVHNEGRLDDSKKAEAVRDYISKRSDLLSLDEDEAIILSGEYCKHIIDILMAFFNALDKIRKVKDEKK